METTLDQIKRLEASLLAEIFHLETSLGKLEGEELWLAQDSLKDLKQSLELIEQSRQLYKDANTSQEIAGI